MRTTDLRKNPSYCPSCGGVCSAASHHGTATPSPGDVSICWYCGNILVFDDELKVRMPTKDEYPQILSDPEVMRVLDEWIKSKGGNKQ